MHTLWLDVSAGAAGDMILGALVDAGAPFAELEALPARLHLDGVRVSRRSVTRSSLAACLVEVGLPDGAHGHDHHHHGHDRAWREVRALLEGADLPAAVRADALRVFGRLAEAEGRAHGIPPEEVHFHEVGAEDALIDIVGACLLLHALGVDEIRASALPVGKGRVQTAHGRLPVPVPAVLELSRGWPLVQDDREGELVTPTGAALVTTLARHGPCPSMVPRSTGHGAGSRDDPGVPNLVRAVLGDHGHGAPAEEVEVLATNVDDLPGEWVPPLIDALFDAGAIDVTCTPTLMKKGRPGMVVEALCPPGRRPQVEEALFRHGATLGVRRWRAGRTTLERRVRTVETPDGPIRIKEGLLDGVVVRRAPEFEDCLRVARATGRPVREVVARHLAGED